MLPPWRVTYAHDEHEYSLEISGITREKPTPGEKVGDLYSESILEVNGELLPILEIPRFYYKDKAAYEAFVDDFFKRHNGKDHLVIDLRRNPGGDGRWGFFVLDYLTDKPYLLYSSIEIMEGLLRFQRLVVSIIIICELPDLHSMIESALRSLWLHHWNLLGFRY